MEEKLKELLKWSNPLKAQKKAELWLGNGAKLYVSSKPNKKYEIMNPYTGKYISFGSMGYEDFTKHNDKTRQERYLKRATKIRGNWHNNKYSPNNLSIHILW